MAVIAKEPLPGRVKTRLCPPCTHEQAAAIAEAALRDTLDAVTAARVGRRVLVLDGTRPSWVPDCFEAVPQRGGGLDERLAAAFTDLGGPAVIIGMDTPQVTAPLLDEVVASLCRPGCRAVLGPANDGGYWAIGLRTPDPAALLGVPMSESRTGAEQRARLDDLGLRTTIVPALTDLDTFDEAVEVSLIAPGPHFRSVVNGIRVALDPA